MMRWNGERVLSGTRVVPRFFVLLPSLFPLSPLAQVLELGDRVRQDGVLGAFNAVPALASTGRPPGGRVQEGPGGVAVRAAVLSRPRAG